MESSLERKTGTVTKPAPAKLFLSRLHVCAKRADVDSAKAIFNELLAAQVPCTPEVCGVLLHIYCDAHGRDRADNEVGRDLMEEALAVFNATKTAGCVPDEAAWTGLIKLCCLHDDPDNALAHVDAMSAAGVPPRLRTFAPILSYACSNGDRSLADECIHRITNAGLALGAAEHLDLVKLATSNSSTCAVTLALRQMALDHPCLCSAHVDVLRAAFDDKPSRPCGWRMLDTSIDRFGVCAVTGARLRAAALPPSERTELLSAVPRLVGSSDKIHEFEKFTTWLNRQVDLHGPYDYVLDGANIGFHGHSKREAAFRKVAAARRQRPASDGARKTPVGSFASSDNGGTSADGAGISVKGSGAFYCTQIERVLEAVHQVAPTARTLVILHVSHTDSRFLQPAEAALVHRWRRAGALFVSPPGMNDDWYWLYAALASGDQCKVVSNDEMRDHHFGMLHARALLSWKERHVVHFNMPPWSSSSQRPALLLSLPYSRAMQESAGGLWHLPWVSDLSRAGEQGESPGWVCLIPPRFMPLSAPGFL